MAMTKGTAGMGTGENAQYMKKGGQKKGKIGKMSNPNPKATVKPSKKMGGSSYKMGGKKGM